MHVSAAWMIPRSGLRWEQQQCTDCLSHNFLAELTVFSCFFVQKLCHYLQLSEIIASVENPACYLVETERWIIFSVDNLQIGLLISLWNRSVWRMKRPDFSTWLDFMCKCTYFSSLQQLESCKPAQLALWQGVTKAIDSGVCSISFILICQKGIGLPFH